MEMVSSVAYLVGIEFTDLIQGFSLSSSAPVCLHSPRVVEARGA